MRAKCVGLSCEVAKETGQEAFQTWTLVTHLQSLLSESVNISKFVPIRMVDKIKFNNTLCVQELGNRYFQMLVGNSAIFIQIKRHGLGMELKG
jgi:hypothetical protein